MSKERIIIIVLIFTSSKCLLFILSLDFSDKRNQELQWMVIIVTKEIVDSATNPNCGAFSVYYGEEVVNLINTDCLQGESPED